MFNKTKKDFESGAFSDNPNKLSEPKSEKKTVSPIKITICMVGGLGSLMFIGFLCYSMVKSELTIESLLSILLAFFSIFISIFFYFKADETSTNFYNSSYEFMKDISITLGKIEERFGEKLNSLNEKVSHLDQIRTEKNKEIQDKMDDKYSIINDLMDKANLSEEERKKYKTQLEEKDNEIESLRMSKFKAEREARILRKRIYGMEERDVLPPRSLLEYLLDTHDVGRLGIAAKRNLIRLGLMDGDENINEAAIIELLESRY